MCAVQFVHSMLDVQNAPRLFVYVIRCVYDLPFRMYVHNMCINACCCMPKHLMHVVSI